MDGKRTGDSGCSMDKSRGGGAISFNEDTLFSLKFHLINLRCPSVGVCKDDQGIAGKKKADGADKADGVSKVDGGGADAEKPDGADEVDGVGRGGTDAEEPDGADKVDKADRADRANEADGADGANGIDGADRANKTDGADGVDGADRADGGGADVEKPGNPGDPGLRDPRAEKQRLVRQAATRLSFFYFHIVFCLFFSSFKSETCGSA